MRKIGGHFLNSAGSMDFTPASQDSSTFNADALDITRFPRHPGSKRVQCRSVYRHKFVAGERSALRLLPLLSWSRTTTAYITHHPGYIHRALVAPTEPPNQSTKGS